MPASPLRTPQRASAQGLNRIDNCTRGPVQKCESRPGRKRRERLARKLDSSSDLLLHRGGDAFGVEEEALRQLRSCAIGSRRPFRRSIKGRQQRRGEQMRSLEGTRLAEPFKRHGGRRRSGMLADTRAELGRCTASDGSSCAMERVPRRLQTASRSSGELCGRSARAAACRSRGLCRARRISCSCRHLRPASR